MQALVRMGHRRLRKIKNANGFPKPENMVPLAGLEPALLAEPDFESGVSTNSTIEALPAQIHRRRVPGQWRNAAADGIAQFLLGLN